MRTTLLSIVRLFSVVFRSAKSRLTRYFAEQNTTFVFRTMLRRMNDQHGVFSANATIRLEEFVLVLNEMVLLLVLDPAMRNEYEYRLRLSTSTKHDGFQASGN